MISLIIILCLVMSIFVGSLYFMNSVRAEQNRYNSRTITGGDLLFFLFGAFFVGIFWPITIWIALLVWKVNKNEATPGWVGDIKDICSFFKNIFEKVTKCRK